jgi:hypothetical protein
MKQIQATTSLSIPEADKIDAPGDGCWDKADKAKDERTENM